MCSERSAARQTFLAEYDLDTVDLTPIAGDASARRYWRLQSAFGPSVLMDADPAKGENTQRFHDLANFLIEQGFRAPQVFAADHINGFLICEDFGDQLLARLVQSDRDQERNYYRHAVDMLLALSNIPVPEFVENYDSAGMARAIDLAFLEYAFVVQGTDDTDFLESVMTRLLNILNALPSKAPVLSLRDCHAENLFVLPTEHSTDIGLIDFQDAVATHPIYDLSSLLRDVRRDVSSEVEIELVHAFGAAQSWDHEELWAAYSVLTFQRNLRILGIFSKLSRLRPNSDYLSFMPRVWRHVTFGLAHPVFDGFRDEFLMQFPAPTPENLRRLKA